jgi:hypothetical protein
MPDLSNHRRRTKPRRRWLKSMLASSFLTSEATIFLANRYKTFTAIETWNACGLHQLKQYRFVVLLLSFRPKHDRANRLRAGTE